MALDYKRPEELPRRRRRCTCGFWFMTGALLGALGVALAWMLEGTRVEEAAAPPTTDQETPAETKPHFEYAHFLPELEVVVPDDQAVDYPPALPPPRPPESPKSPAVAAAPEPPPATPASPPAGNQVPKAGGGDTYLLQVASFKNAADAERLKTRLTGLGLSSSVQQVTINGKDTYHRVRTGPYVGKAAANQARALLTGKGLESLMIRLKE